jgi:hypothetical protein
MRTVLSLTVAVAFAGFLAAPLVTSADETVIEKNSTYNSEHRVESAPPAVRERTTVETEPAAPMVQKRTSETMVKGDSDHDSKTKTETKTKVEHDDD